MKTIKMIFDKNVIEEYTNYYFSLHPKAKKPPIKQPYHESINTWMIMRRPAMNALKGKWKQFMVWFVEREGYTNLHIDQCEMTFKTYFPNHRRHDPDNCTPKFLLDGMVESGMIIDDDMEHIRMLSLVCGIDTERPRTEIIITKIRIKGE